MMKNANFFFLYNLETYQKNCLKKSMKLFLDFYLVIVKKIMVKLANLHSRVHYFLAVRRFPRPRKPGQRCCASHHKALRTHRPPSCALGRRETDSATQCKLIGCPLSLAAEKMVTSVREGVFLSRDSPYRATVTRQ